MTKTPDNFLQLKLLAPPDYDAYFALRLESLRTCPHMFATNANDWENASREVIEKHLQASEAAKSPIIGAWKGDKLVGLVGLKPDFRPTVQHKAALWGLYIAPDHRRQGVGSRLLEEAVKAAKEIEALQQLRAVVNATSQEAVALFQSAGFQQYGLEPRAKFVDGVYHDQLYFWYPLDDENELYSN